MKVQEPKILNTMKMTELYTSKSADTMTCKKKFDNKLEILSLNNTSSITFKTSRLTTLKFRSV